MAKLIGYARVSTRTRDADRQITDLLAAGVRRDDLYTDRGVSGARPRRPKFDKALAALHEGDTLVITTLDRLGRSTANMLDLSTELRTRGINLRVLNLGSGNVDTGTPMGGMVFTVMAALAQMELEIANASPTAQTPLLLHNSRTRLMRYGVPGEPGGNHHVLLAGASNTGESRPRLSSSTESRTFTLHRYPFAPWWLLASTDDAI